MRLEGGLEMDHAVLLDHRTDGRDDRLVCLIRISDGNHLKLRPGLELVELVFQHIEADFQVFGIHDVEERHAGLGGAVKGGVDPADGTRQGRRDGAVRELVLQLLQGRLGRIAAGIDAGLAPDLLGRLVELVALVALTHQDGLVLVFGALQLSLGAGDLVLQHILAETRHHFPFPHPLAQDDVEPDDLLADAAVDRHFPDGLDGPFARESIRFDGPLQVLSLRDCDLLRLGRFLRRFLRRSRRPGLTGGDRHGQDNEGKKPIHAASVLRDGNRWSSNWPAR